MKIERVVASSDTHQVILLSGEEGEDVGPFHDCDGWWVQEDAEAEARDMLAGHGWEFSHEREFWHEAELMVCGERETIAHLFSLPLPASPPKAPLSDMKEALSSVRKADTTHIRTPLLVYGARACEYGSAKYERANYLRPVGGPAADFERLRAYLRAAKSHIEAVLDSMEMHQSQDPKLVDVEGMKTAAYCKDTDTKPGDKVGPSGLPHLCGAVASLMMGITQATVYGLLPADPGQPWTKRMEEG